MNTAVMPSSLALLQSFLAFDFGQKRTGVAYASRLLGQAQPQGTVNASGDARWPLIAKHIERWQPDALVVGVPYHPDGAAHENTALAKKFARQLQGRFALPVFEVDERYSTTEAKSGGAVDVDAASACVILDQFLRNLTP
ncbi:MAG: Holliday junction resolvase RuvX [Betaproteobacteria bacterium]|jgi:putative Holliday junction resolvase|nr:Holliday junction resolvase RuvX [Burkholderiales bacterium]